MSKILKKMVLESGNRPLSWTARTQIALDAAKGIEYIHDHTKARYVHRDIKTSNILLDDGLRAKVPRTHSFLPSGYSASTLSFGQFIYFQKSITYIDNYMPTLYHRRV
jgi:serine/threonine protein kinase